MRSLVAALSLCIGVSLGGACATAPVSPPVSQPVEKRAPRPKAQKKKPARAPEAPLVVEGPADEEPPDGPPPEGEDTWEEGMASFYADSLAGNRTASGERYRIDRRTCAHRTLPFGTVLEVSASNGRTTTCRVNDRGPFAKGRVLDVSKKCAKELGMIAAGVLRVRFKQAHDSGDPG